MSLFQKFKVVVEIGLILTVLTLLIRLAGEEDRKTTPASTYEDQFTSIPTLLSDIEDFIGESAPRNTSYAYIPVYSHVYSQHDRPIPLVVMLSLRNADMKKAVKVHKVLYYNTKGQLIREYFAEGTSLSPMETKEVLIKKKDLEGGSGANFIVLFTMEDQTIPPIFETFMSGGEEDRGFSFSSRGTIYTTPDTGKDQNS